MIGSNRALIAFTGLRPPREKAKNLRSITELVEVGMVRAVLDRCNPLAQTAEAHRYVETGHKTGNVVTRCEGRAIARSGGAPRSGPARQRLPPDEAHFPTARVGIVPDHLLMRSPPPFQRTLSVGPR